jgi:deoxyribodipyrimidine photo-lyase
MSLISPVLVWFRDDLRLRDNPALHEAVASHKPVLCVFVLEEGDGLRPLGGASQFWLSGSLKALQQDLRRLGGELVILRGASSHLIPEFAKQCGAESVHWNRRYGETERTLDQTIKEILQKQGITAKSFNGRLVYEPWEIANAANQPFRVFTPFWKAVLAKGEPDKPLPAPSAVQSPPLPEGVDVLSVETLKLEPSQPDWAAQMRVMWCPGEDGAQKALTQFLDGPLNGYATRRDFPGDEGTSRLSPHLRFGEISVRDIRAQLLEKQEAGTVSSIDGVKFWSEIGWREFSNHLLYLYGDLSQHPLQPAFADFPFCKDEPALKAWQHGRTGYPIVDAGMRQLWQTGWMHNRVRMVVASFLIKHLLIDWRDGEAWFWDTLLEADPASNGASWQWVAGCGADASPWHRIFNPVLQGEKFDPDGIYVRRFVPELASLPNEFLHKPWEAPKSLLSNAANVSGRSYPEPVVEHAMARNRAIEAFQTIKKQPLSLIP